MKQYFTLVSKKYFDNKVFISESKYSSEIILDECKKISPKNIKKNNWKKIKLELIKKKTINFFLKLIISILKPFKKNYEDKKFENLEEMIIKDKVRKIQEILKSKSELNIKKIADKCFLIRKI